jgi:hypothetical protein
VIVVVSVIAGVVVSLTTVPAKPFADTIETLVTVPVPEPAGVAFSKVFKPVLRKNCPVPETGNIARFVRVNISKLVDCSPSAAI